MRGINFSVIILLKVPFPCFPSVQMVEMEEGNEPDEFWECLGGKGDYASGVELEALVRTDYKTYIIWWCSDPYFPIFNL